MTYATRDDMETRFGLAELVQLTDDDGTGEVVLSKLDTALADADQVINGYAAGTYAVPLSPVPDLVTRWACDIARYFLHRDGVTELVEKNYKAALLALKDVAKGDLILECQGLEAEEAMTDDDDLATYDDAPSIMSGGPWHG